MDVEDIDSWYEEEKQKCLEEYLKDLELGKNKKKSEDKYERGIQSAIRRYNELMDEKLSRRKKSKIGDIVSNIKSKFILLRK